MRPWAARATTALASAVVALGVGVGATEAVSALVAALACVPAIVVAWALVVRRPESAVGPALAWSTACVTLVSGDVVPGDGPTTHLSVGLWPVNLAGVLALLLVFPAGRLPRGRWAAVGWVYLAATVGIVAAAWDEQQVDGRVVGEQSGWQTTVEWVAVPTVALCLGAGIVRLVLVHRRGTSREREQVRWLALVGVVVVALLVAGWTALALGAPIAAAFLPFLLALVVLVPLAVAVAVVRYDLYDVDRLLGETTSLVLTVLMSAAVFGAVVLVVSRVVDQRSTLTATTAAFVTALVLLPLHRALSRGVERVVDRDRTVALEAVRKFAADVSHGVRAPEDVEAVLRQASRDPDLRLVVHAADGRWVQVDGSDAPDGEPDSERDGDSADRADVDAVERAFGPPAVVTLEARGEPVASVLVSRPTARARRLAGELARAAWVPIEVCRLRLELRGALAETRASRERLARGNAAERRRWERDLHDGAQQHLVAVGVRLSLLQRDLAGPPADELGVAVDEIRACLDELRHLAHGMRPSRLDDGLGNALAAVREASPVPLELEVAELPELDDTRSLTAYLVVSEAVSNVLKHASASRIVVRVCAQGDRVTVEVDDDGVGGVPADAPLSALRDRVLSVGGSLRVRSEHGLGTNIRAVL